MLMSSWDTKSLCIVLGFEIRQAGLPCLRSGSMVGGHWGRPFGLGLVEALPYDLLGGKPARAEVRTPPGGRSPCPAAQVRLVRAC